MTALSLRLKIYLCSPRTRCRQGRGRKRQIARGRCPLYGEVNTQGAREKERPTTYSGHFRYCLPVTMAAGPRRDSTEVPSNLVSPSTDKKPFADLRRDFGSTDWETKQPSSVPPPPASRKNLLPSFDAHDSTGDDDGVPIDYTSTSHRGRPRPPTTTPPRPCGGGIIGTRWTAAIPSSPVVCAIFEGTGGSAARRLLLSLRYGTA